VGGPHAAGISRGPGQSGPVPDGLDVATLTRDPKDVHVCALAIAGNAELLFTFDRGYLKEPLREHGVEVPGLDGFLVDQCKQQPEVFVRIVERQANAWDGGHPVAELLAAFSRANVPRFAESLAPLVEPSS